MSSICRLSFLESYEGVNFFLKPLVAGISFKEKGLIEPKSSRTYGGRKTEKLFLLPTGEIAVKLLFEDVIDNGDGTYTVTNDVNAVTHIKKVTHICDTNDNVWYEKTNYEIVKNHKKLAKSRATYAIDYLTETAEQLGASDVVKQIFNHFKQGFDEWKDLGDPQTFIDLLNNEPPTIDGNPNVMYHTINAPIPGFAPKTFKDSLIEQLTGIKWQSV